MKNHIKAFVTVFVVGVLFVVVYRHYLSPTIHPVEPKSPVKVQEGASLKDLVQSTTKSLEGKEVDFLKHTGKVLIINFWASWCGPCIEEVPSLIKLVKEFKGDIHVIAVSGDSSLEDIQIFLKSFPQFSSDNIQVTWDQDRSLMKTFDVVRLPESLIFDGEGKFVKKVSGSIDWYNKESIGYMRALLSGNSNSH